MGLQVILVLALISCASAAPWRCYRACDGSTVCIGDHGQPVIAPPSIAMGQPCPPCTGPATVYTPCQYTPNPCSPPPCPEPCPQPCPPPCPPPPCY